MTGSFVVAFVIAPAAVVLLGWAAMLLHERSLRRDQGKAAE